MLISIVEKRNKPVQTEICFSKKEWSGVPETVKQSFLKLEAKETARQMKFYIDGDLLNNKPRPNDVLQGKAAT